MTSFNIKKGKNILTKDQQKELLLEQKKVLDNIQVLFPIEKLEKEKTELEKMQTSPDFFSNLKQVENVGKKIARLENRIAEVKNLKVQFDSLSSILDECSDADVEILSDTEKELKDFIKNSTDLELVGLFTGKYDSAGAILTIQAGAGGTEACDWTQMLLRMYEKYFIKRGFSFKVLDSTDGDGAGLKSVTIKVDGENAYGYLKAERGVHRLVRISPFDSNKRRHTSFASVEVMPEIENENDVVIKPEDLKIDVFRSGGCGGQGVNTTDSAVRIRHIPTGIVVTCQNERSQIQNRENALACLRARLAQMEEEKMQNSMKQIQGELKKIEWGSQIRSYVFCPYTMVKDHRTDWETSDVFGFMDGNIHECILDYLKKSVSKK